MASGSSRRASHSGIANPVKESYGTTEVKKGVISDENTTENQSSSQLLSELELYCCNLDKSIGELCSDFSCFRGESEESKLKSLERQIQEVHKRVRILKDKQELGDTQKELAKVHLAQKDPSSSSGGENEERTCSEPKDGHDHQQHQQVAPPPPQPSAVPPLPATQPRQQTAPIASKDDFLCKLITNSLRALEKVQADDHKRNSELCIHVDFNKTHKTLSVMDNGIGMTKAELEMDLCSTHGVLRSAFVAADKVVVTTKHDEDEQYVCEASRGGDHSFKIDRDDDGETSLGINARGTKITLFLKDDHLEYLEECTLKRLVDRHFMRNDYPLVIRNYNSSNECQDELVHPSGILGWLRFTPIVSILERYLLESFPDEVDALKKKNEETKKKKRSKGEVSFEEKKKELDRLRKVMAKVVGKKVEKVVVSEGSVFPKMACTLSVDPKSKAITMLVNPWEPHGILDWLAELVAEDCVKYFKVVSKIISKLFAMAALRKTYSA